MKTIERDNICLFNTDNNVANAHNSQKRGWNVKNQLKD